MLKFDSIIKSINNLQIALENNSDIIKPAINVISSFNEIRPDILKIRYNINKKKITKFIEEFQKSNQQSVNIILSESIYDSFFIDKIFKIITKLINIFKPNIITINKHAVGALVLQFNNFDIIKLEEIKDQLLFFDSYIFENKLFVSNIGSLEKFLLVKSEFGNVALPFSNLEISEYNSGNIKMKILSKSFNFEYEIIKELQCYRQMVDSIIDTKFFNGVIIDNNDEVVPILSSTYLYSKEQ